MPYTWDDFYREFTKEHLDLLPAEDRLKGLPVEAFLKNMPAEAIEACLKKLRKRRSPRKRK